MSRLNKIFFICLLLNYISCLQPQLNEDRKKPIEIKIGSEVEYDKNINYFQFNFAGSNDSKIFLFFYHFENDIYLTDPTGERNKVEKESNLLYIGNLTLNGTYTLELICKTIYCEIGGKFMAIIPGIIIETIDLNKNVYFFNFGLSLDIYYDTISYKVSNLKENKTVCFINLDNNNPESAYYEPFYQDEDENDKSNSEEEPEPNFTDTDKDDDDPYNPYDKEEKDDKEGIYNLIKESEKESEDKWDDNNPSGKYYPEYFPEKTIFEIYNINENITTKNVSFYEFKRGNEYIITIHSLKKKYDPKDGRYYSQFIIPRYMFFPITSQNFKEITGNEGILTLDGPIVGIIKANTHKDLTIYIDYMDFNNLFWAKTNDIFTLDNITLLSKLNFSESINLLNIPQNESQNLVIFSFSSDFLSKIKIFIADEFENNCDSFFMPKNTAKLISCVQEGENNYLNYIVTFSSNKKNMRITFSEEDEATDYIIQNSLTLLIYVQRINEDSTINVKKYPPKFAYFLAENPYIFKAFYHYEKKSLDIDGGINLDNYIKFSPINIRYNTRSMPRIEFYNFYINKPELKANIYIRQFYGGSDLYECDADENDQKDLTFLTTPISNAKCKNKKSILNRPFSLDGTKVISGYLIPDSYIDVYVEVDDDKNKMIDISLLFSEDGGNNNGAKYLKKDVEYKINFFLNHLIKLEPGFNAQITINNGQTSSIIDIEKPTVVLYGEGFTLKSNNDAMVYFYNKLPEPYVNQTEIDIEKSKGKIVKISNFDSNEVRIEIGFKGFYPTFNQIDFGIRKNKELYIDNVYDKLKGKLLKDEKLYIYTSYERNKNLKIEYIGNNLNNENNDFNIFLIHENEGEKTLIINAYLSEILIYEFYFCKNDTMINVSYLGKDEYEKQIILTNNDNNSYGKMDLFTEDNKISFSTNQSVIFTYSYEDPIDSSLFNENSSYYKERKVLNDLKIDEIADKNNNDNIITIKFKPNYKQSSTRYIIIIAQKNEKNSFENFKDPCYITGLLNKRPSGIKVDTIYDVGIDDSINAEVDISDILHNDNYYMINIISQELRFEKKIQFYEPSEFSHIGKKIEPNENENGTPSPNEEDKDDGISSVLAIVIPIVVIIIILIIVVIIFVIRRKRRSNYSEDIEKLNGI